MKVVLADGSIAVVNKDSTVFLSPIKRTVQHTESNNLFFALRFFLLILIRKLNEVIFKGSRKQLWHCD